MVAPAIERLRIRDTGSVQLDQGIASCSRHPGDECPVADLRHGPLSEHPVRSVELGLGCCHREGLILRVETAGVAEGLPPPPPIRDEAQRPLRVPLWLADRFGRASGDSLRRPDRLQHVVLVRRVRRPGLWAAAGSWRHPTACPGGSRRPRRDGPRWGVAGAYRRSPMPVEQEWSRRATRSGSKGPRSDAEVESTPSPMDLSHGQHPLAVRRGAQPTVVVHLTGRRRVRPGPPVRPRRRGAGRPLRHRTTPVGPTGRHRRTAPADRPGTRQNAPPPYSLTRLRMLTPSGEWSARPSGIGPHDHGPARLGRAGLEPVDRVAVRADFRQRDLGPGHVARRRAARPNPHTLRSWPRSERTRCNRTGQKAAARRSTVNPCASRPICSPRRGRSSGPPWSSCPTPTSPRARCSSGSSGPPSTSRTPW